MIRCPYPPTILNEDSEVEILNDKYVLWHEGYEAHKAEMANSTSMMASLVQAYTRAYLKVKELELELRANKR